MPTKAEVADALDAAADLYESERYDWCQGQSVSADGLSVCASQALSLATGATFTMTVSIGNPFLGGLKHDMSGWNQPLYRAAEVALLPYTQEAGGIIGFNDSGQGRSKQDIIDLFKKTAKELRDGDQG